MYACGRYSMKPTRSSIGRCRPSAALLPRKSPSVHLPLKGWCGNAKYQQFTVLDDVVTVSAEIRVEAVTVLHLREQAEVQGGRREGAYEKRFR
jgi:hypothetical protein